MLKLKVGDTVKIQSGKDKGREGKVEKIYAKKGTLIVSGLNIYKKHIKGSPGQKGGIFEIPRPLAFARVSLICPKCKKSTRVGFRLTGKEKTRVCKKCNKSIDSK